MNKNLLGSLVVGASLSLAAPVVGAYTITYTTGPAVLCATGNNPSQPAFEAGVQSAACGGSSVVELYKDNFGGTESGSFASSYQTSFAPSSDPTDATISYVGAPALAINCSILGCWLGVKDGSQEPAWYVFNISNWNGTSSIVMTDFWANTQGAISNVSIWGGIATSSSSSSGDPGSSSSGTQVPTPASSLVLLGLGLLGLGFMRRRAHSA